MYIHCSFKNIIVLNETIDIQNLLKTSLLMLLLQMARNWNLWIYKSFSTLIYFTKKDLNS